jgi:hypothetical protein
MTDTNKTPEDLKKKNSGPTWDLAGSPAPWIPLSLSDSVLVETLEAVKNSLVPVVEAAKTIIDIIKTIVEAALNLILGAVDVGAAAVKAAIAAVRDLLENILDVGSFYTLLVPVGRTDLETSGKIMTDAVLGGNPYPEQLPISGEDLLGSGGNYGFMRTVIDSMNDSKDPNRPRFSQDAHIAAGVIVLGTTNLYDLLAVIDKFFGALKVPGSNTYYKPSSQPRGLRATVVPSSYGTKFGGPDDDNIAGDPDGDHPYAVKLEWEHEDRVINVDDFGYTTAIGRVLIFRAEDPDVIDLASTRNWAQWEVGSMPFDELTNEFFDNTIEVGKRYSYGVGFELAIENEDGFTVGAYLRTIQTARVSTTNIQMAATHGVPPDWVKYNLLDMLFPQARVFVEQYLIKFLDSLEDSLEDITAAIREYIEFLQEEIDRYSSWVEDILSRIQDLIEALTWPNVYAGATFIYSEPTLEGGGGNRFFISQLAKALYATDDTHRPPFDSGNEAVAGLVLMAGSESAGTIKRFRTFLETFLGSAEASVGSPMQQALDSIDYLTEQAERQLCMNPMFEAVLCTEEEPAGHAFDPKFEPAAEAAECGKKES